MLYTGEYELGEWVLGESVQGEMLLICSKGGIGQSESLWGL